MIGLADSIAKNAVPSVCGEAYPSNRGIHGIQMTGPVGAIREMGD